MTYNGVLEYWAVQVLKSLSFLHGRELLGSEEDDNLISPNGIQVPFVQPLITNYQVQYNNIPQHLLKLTREGNFSVRYFNF